MPSLPSSQQLKELSREQWKENRPSLFKTLQESRDLEKTLTSRFPYPSAQSSRECCPILRRGEAVKLLSSRTVNHLFARLRLIIARKFS